MKLKKYLDVVCNSCFLILLNMISFSVFALEAPVADKSFAYFIYDVAVIKIAQGPIGFVAAMFAIIYSAMHITKNWMLSILGIIGGSILIKADKIVASMGALIDIVS